MNFKKFISGVSALAIAASAFAGLAVTANAYTSTASSIDGGSTKITQDFESESAGWTRDSSGSSFVGVETANSNANTTNIYGVPYNDAKSGCAHLTISPAKTADSTNVSFDFKIDAGSQNNANTLQLISGVGSKSGWVTGTAFLDIRITASGNGYAANGFTVNSNAVTTNAIVNNERATQSGLEDRASTGWLHLDAVLDFTSDTMNIAITRKSDSSAVYSNANLAFSNNVDSFNGIALTAAKLYGGTYIDNIEIKDNPVASSIVITGDDTVAAGNSAYYTAAVLDQYGDKYADADLTATGYTNASYSDGTITVPSNFENDETITLTASYEGLENVTKTVTASALKGYIINTRPYAAISVDGAAAVSTGSEGKYTFDLGTTGEHSVVISKDGYQEVNTTVTAADNDSTDLPLNPNSGIVYQEDFTYVNDNFGTTTSQTTVSNGVFQTNNTKSVNDSITLPEAVNIAGSVITIRAKMNNNERATYLSLKNDTTNILPLNFDSAGNIKTNWSDQKVVLLSSRGTDYHLIQMYMPKNDSGNNRIILYIDGVKCNVDDIAHVNSYSLNTITWANPGSSAGVLTIDYIKVENSPAEDNVEPTATVTVDGTATSYLIGTTLTLPTADEGKVWSADGTTEVASTTITVTGDATYTQINDPSGPSAAVTGVSYNQYAGGAFDGDNAVTAAKVLVTVNGQITRLGLKYSENGTDWTDPQYAQNLPELTNGTILLGAIVPGQVDLTTSSFDAVFETATVD